VADHRKKTKAPGSSRCPGLGEALPARRDEYRDVYERWLSAPYQERRDVVLDRRRDLGDAVAPIHVDLAAHAAAAFAIGAGLDREAGKRDEEALVASLEVVEVRAVAVHLGADRVAEAMEEMGVQTSLAKRRAGHVIGLEPLRLDAGAGARLEERDGGIACAGDRFPDFLHFVGDAGA